MNKKLIIVLNVIILTIVLIYYYINPVYSTKDYILNNNPVYSSKGYILNNNLESSIGISIHSTDPSPNEMEKIYNAGFSIVRIDLPWSHIEKNKGVYDFSQYDKLINKLNKNKINTLFILDYGNPLYDNGLAPYSDYGRKAFSNFAKEAVKHYKGNPIIWEIWNEPNIKYWKPYPDVQNYYKLAMNTITAIKSVDKDAFIVAPALSGLDYNYLNYLGKNNLFKYIDAISIHPYRQSNPETAIYDYNKIKDLINKYPHKENIQLFCGEWGYSTAWKNMNELKQAQYCIREYLINIMCGVNLTIWYDWKDDGTNKSNVEHNFGCVYNNLEPKTSYYAVITLTNVLKGYKFITRINNEKNSDYILMFKKDNKVAYALWTTGKSHELNIKLNNNNIIKVVDFTGNSYENRAINNLHKINISNSVIYITDVDYDPNYNITVK